MHPPVELIPEFVEYIPAEKKAGILYISEKFEIAIHLCCCGCGLQSVTSLGEGGWTLIKNGDKVSLTPSIGNFSGEDPYHAHYIITDNIATFV